MRYDIEPTDQEQRTRGETSEQGLLDDSVNTFLARVQTLRVLHLDRADSVALMQAGERLRAQCAHRTEPLLVVALVGGTGVGKSSLINSLAGAPIAPVGETRPTTNTLYVYHHRMVSAEALPKEVTAEAVLVAHERPELRNKVLVDTPDLDSFAHTHRQRTRQLLKAAGLVLYVFSPEKYRDERTWSVLGEERRFSTSAAVLNKSDEFSSAEELALVVADLRQGFTAIGLEDIRIFCTSTILKPQHSAGEGTPTAISPPNIAALREFLERELQESAVARLQRAQRNNIVSHLRDTVDRVAPDHLVTICDELIHTVHEQSGEAATRLRNALTVCLSLATQELAPLCILRQHERFHGPFRTWLAIADFLRFGLPRTVRSLVRETRHDSHGVVEEMLANGHGQRVEDFLQQEAQAIQDLLYARGLPVHQWRTITTPFSGERLVRNLAGELETAFDVAATEAVKTGRWLVWLISVLGTLVPAAFVFAGLYLLGRDFLRGDYDGLSLLGHLFATMILFFLVLQGIINVLLPSPRRMSQELQDKALSTVVGRIMEGWLQVYRAALTADLADLRRPLHLLALS